MGLPSAKLREIVFQFLFCHDFNIAEEKEIIKALMYIHKVSKKWAVEALSRMNQILPHLQEIDEKISFASKDYSIDRIYRAEKNLLRLCVFELFFDDTIPEKVAIAEGIRLSRKFSTPESSKFVNAVLDSLYKKSVEENKV